MKKENSKDDCIKTLNSEPQKPLEIEASKREKEQFAWKLGLTALGASLTISFPL